MSWILNAFCKRDVLSITPEPLQTFQVSSRGHSGPKMERALNEVIWALLVLGAPVEPFLHFMHVSSDSVPQLVLVSLDPFEFVLRISFVAWCLYTTLTACMIWIRPWILTAFVENKRWNMFFGYQISIFRIVLGKKKVPRVFTFPSLYSDLTHVYPPAFALQEFERLEFFAGHAALTRAMRRDGVRAARFDLNYVKKGDHKRKSNWMDLLSSSGFGFLECFVLNCYPTCR